MIVVAGESLIDLVVGPDGAVTATPGGGPFNVARAIGRLGLPVAFVGRLSTDAFGRRLRAALTADGVDLSRAAVTDDPTLLAVADLDAAGNAAYRFHVAGTAAAGLTAGDLATVPTDPSALHVGTLGLVLEPMASAIEGLVARAGPGVLVMADPNVRPAAINDEAAFRARLDRVLGRVDVVKVSVDDLRWLLPGVEPSAAARGLVGRGPAAVLVTDGPRPVLIVTPAGVGDVPVPAMTVVDSIGAGDVFCGGFLAAWVGAGHGRAELADGDALAWAVTAAIEVAARSVGRAGADPPTAAEVGSAVSRWYPRQP